MISLFRRTSLARLSGGVPRLTHQISYTISTRSIPSLRLLPSIQRSLNISHGFHTHYRLFARPEYGRGRYPRYGPRQQQYEQEYEKQYEEQQEQQRPRRSSFPSSLTLRRIALIACPGAAIFYYMNLETVPVSGRRRFNCISPSSAEAQGELAYQQILQQEQKNGRILPPSDPRTRMVERVMARLIKGGKLGTGTAGEHVGWEINVIDDPATKNAFVLPGGKVFVYTGILPICRNDAGLAAVLGHEAAHNICQHVAERMSSIVYLQPLIWSLMYIDLVLLGTPVGFSHFIGSWLLDLVVSRPGSRQQESEADHVGLLLMAQACYDPKEAPRFWERMETANELSPPEWLSTHPSNEHRVEAITRLIPKAEEESLKSGCGLTSNYADPFKRAIQGSFW